MRSRLYFKLLAWFLGASILATVATLIVVQPLWLAIDESAERLPVWGQQAAETYERRGEDGLRKFLRELRNKHGVHALLLDQQHQPVARLRMPPQLREQLLRPQNSHRDRRLYTARVSRMVIRGGQQQYYWHVLRPPPGPEQWRRLGPARLLVFLLVMALAAWLFTFWLGRPIKRLRAATEDMTAGNLGSRVDDALSQRKDEIGALANAFNRMAGRVQTLVSNKERLLRDVSHELRSPLARLEVALELARERGGDSVAQELARIDLETQRLKSLIDQVMSLSRLEDPDAAYSFEPLDFSALLQTTCDELAQLPNTRLSANIPPGLHVQGNPGLLRSAVENIIRNAIKYSPEHGEVEITLEDHQTELQLKVRDHGQGVPEEQLSNIFRPFYRTLEARTRHPEDENGGYGVGLAIVQRVARLHHAQVSAVNHAQGGLEVSLTLPLLRP